MPTLRTLCAMCFIALLLCVLGIEAAPVASPIESTPRGASSSTHAVGASCPLRLVERT